MELTVDRDAFLGAVSLVQSVVDHRNTMPVLTNLHLEATEGELCLRSMDLQVAMQARCPAKVAVAGKTTVSAKRLFSILRELPALSVAFRSDQDDWINLSCGNADFKLVGIPADRYPAFPLMDPGQTSQETERLFEPLTLLDMLKKTVFVAAKEEGRAAFSGVYWILTDGQLELVTTDGHRLAYIRRPLPQLQSGEKETMLLPRRAMTELERILEQHKNVEHVHMYQVGQQILFLVGPIVLSCSILEGRFPNYEMVIPKDNDKHVHLPREGLRQAIRRTALLADDQFRGIQFDLSKDRLLLTSRNKDLGHAREEIDVDYQFTDIQVIFNSNYVLDFLSSLHADEVRVSFKTATSAVLLTDVGDDDYKCILMPMKI